MNPTLFTLLKDDPTIQALFGTDPVRIFPWGRAPQKAQLPYAVYSVYNATTQNYTDRVPDIDAKGTQINIYAANANVLQSCFEAVRDVLEPHGHMTSYATPDLDADTDLYSCRMEFDFWDDR